MKIKKYNAGALTNFEVLDFLKSRGASNDSSRVIAPVALSEYKVYDYLVETPACYQTREQINEFLDKCQRFNLAKAEVLNIIDMKPSQLVEIDPDPSIANERVAMLAYTDIDKSLLKRCTVKLIEQSDKRLGDQLEELVELVNEVFPRPSDPPNAEVAMAE